MFESSKMSLIANFIVFKLKLLGFLKILPNFSFPETVQFMIWFEEITLGDKK